MGWGALFRPIQGALTPTPDELLLLEGALELSQVHWHFSHGLHKDTAKGQAFECIWGRGDKDTDWPRREKWRNQRSPSQQPGVSVPSSLQGTWGWGAVRGEWVEQDRAGCMRQASLLRKTSH